MTCASPIPDYHSSARRDWRIWGMIGAGLFFAWAGASVDPLTNCDEAGNCAPWLVPLAYWMGVGLLLSGLAIAWANPRRGSRIDPATGDLIWWQCRIGGREGDCGRIHPSAIGLIRIIRQSDSSDELHLYDGGGDRQPYFDAEVVPWPQDKWVERLVTAWPHIRVDIRE